MSNKVVYRDYAVGAKENASVDHENTNQQLILHGENYNDDYNADSIFTNETAPNYSSFEGEGILTSLAEVNLYETGDLGFVSDTVSDGSGSFSVAPKLTILLASGYYTGRGLTLHFMGSYCSSVRIKYYHDETLIDESTYTNDEMVRFFSKTVSLYNKIVVEFISTQSAYQFAKVWRVDFGRDVVFESFFSITHNNSMHANSQDLPIGSAEIGINSQEALIFQDDQKILLHQNDTLLDTLFVTGSSHEAKNRYDITAENVIGKLERANYQFESVILQKAKDFAESISTKCGVSVTVDSSLENTWLYCYLPICKGRYAVMQLAFALCAIVVTTPTGEVVIKPIKSEPVSTIDASRFKRAIYKKNDIVTQVDYTQHQYDYSVLDWFNSSYTHVATATLSTAPITIKFTAPISSFKGLHFKNSDGENITDVTITIDYLCDNYVTVHASATKDVYIYALPLIETKILLSKANTSLTVNAKENVLSFDRYTVVPSRSLALQGQDILDSLYDQAIANVGYVDTEFFIQDEKLGDVVDIETENSGTIRGVITKLDTTIGYSSRLAKAVIQQWAL